MDIEDAVVILRQMRDMYELNSDTYIALNMAIDELIASEGELTEGVICNDE